MFHAVDLVNRAVEIICCTSVLMLLYLLRCVGVLSDCTLCPRPLLCWWWCGWTQPLQL